MIDFATAQIDDRRRAIAADFSRVRRTARRKAPQAAPCTVQARRPARV